MTFQEKLVVLRKIKGITQDELACAVGVSRQAVYKWEAGQSYPEVPKLLEMKLLFSVSIDELLDDSFDIELPKKKRKKRTPKAETAPEAAAPVVEEAKVEAPVVEEVKVEEVKVEAPVVEEPKAEKKAKAPKAPKKTETKDVPQFKSELLKKLFANKK